jgi:hypothetical protein
VVIGDAVLGHRHVQLALSVRGPVAAGVRTKLAAAEGGSGKERSDGVAEAGTAAANPEEKMFEG